VPELYLLRFSFNCWEKDLCVVLFCYFLSDFDLPPRLRTAYVSPLSGSLPWFAALMPSLLGTYLLCFDSILYIPWSCHFFIYCVFVSFIPRPTTPSLISDSSSPIWGCQYNLLGQNWLRNLVQLSVCYRRRIGFSEQTGLWERNEQRWGHRAGSAAAKAGDIERPPVVKGELLEIHFQACRSSSNT